MSEQMNGKSGDGSSQPSPTNASDQTSTDSLPGFSEAPAAESTRETADAQQDDDGGGEENDGGLLKSIIGTLSPRGRSAETDSAPLDDLSRRLKQFISPEGISWHETHAELGDICARTYTVSGWPKEAQAHLLYELYTHPELVYNASIHYDPQDSEDAITRLADLEARLEDRAAGEFSDYLPNVEAVKETLQIIQDMKVAVENDGRRLYELSIHITLYAPESDILDKLDRRLRESVTVSGDLDLEMAREFQDEAHLSSSPLGKDAMADNRKHATQLVLDTAAGLTFPLVDDTLVEPSGVIAGFNLANETAVVLDIFNRNNGYNAIILGDIGSGKSHSSGQYLVRHRVVHPEDNIIIIDPMGGFIGVNEAIGGEHITIDGTDVINPLEIKPTPDHILKADEQADPYRMKLDEVRWFFNEFFESYNEEISGEMWAPLNRAIKKAYRDNGITPDPHTHDNPSPTIKDVLENLQDIAENPTDYAATSSGREVEKWENNAASLLMAMEPFRDGNELDNLVGTTDFEIDDSTPTYIDISAYDGKEDSQALMMRIVFSMLYEQVKESSRRSIIAIDEAHKIIGDEESAEHWAELFRHSRHHMLSIQLISQEFEDFFAKEDGDGANEAAKTMANLCTVKRMHRVGNVDRRLAKEGLGLTDDHIDFIEGAVPGEAGRGFTTALLDVEDKGYIGLKVVSTKDEVGVIEHDPTETDTPDPQSPQIKKALEANTALRDGSQLSSEDDELLTEVVDSIPIDEFAPEVAERFIDRLISDSETRYTEADRDLLSYLVTDSDKSITEVAPTIAQAPIDNAGRQVSVRKPPEDAASPAPTADSDTAADATPQRSESTQATPSSGRAPWEDAEEQITPISDTNTATTAADSDPPDDHSTDESDSESTPAPESQTATESSDHPHEDTTEDSPEETTAEHSPPQEDEPSPDPGPEPNEVSSSPSSDASEQQPPTDESDTEAEQDPSQPSPDTDTDSPDNASTDDHTSKGGLLFGPSNSSNGPPEDSNHDAKPASNGQSGPDSSSTQPVESASGEEIPFNDRKHAHSRTLGELSDAQIGRIAAEQSHRLESTPDDRSDLEDKLAIVFARDEVEADGPTAPVTPEDHIEATLGETSHSD